MTKDVGTKYIRLYSPKNLELDSIIEQYPFPGKGYKKDHLQFLVHCLVSRESYCDADYLKAKGKKGSYIPLNAKVLEAKIPGYYKHLEYLKNAGVIECDNSYQVGSVSKGYKLTRQYKGQGFQRVPINDFVLRKKIKRDTPFQSSNEAYKSFPYLAKWFKMLQIDRDAAFQYIDKLEIKGVESLQPGLKQKKIDEYKQQIHEKCTNAKILVNRIAERDFYFEKDSSGQRLHTNLTNLAKGLRKFITYNDESLVAVDIKNSQPYMSIALLKNSFWELTPKKGFLNYKRVNKEGYKEMREEREEIKNSIMFRESSETLDSVEFEKEGFIKNVVKGRFYEYLVALFESRTGLNLGATEMEKRNKVKKMVLTVLFDDGKRIYNKAPDSLNQLFCRKFPTITHIFDLIKRRKYQNLALLLQRIESFLVLSKVCKRISTEQPQVPLYTIHDSIVTTVGNEGYVHSVMRDELTKYMGVPPTLSTEYWH